MSIEKDSEGNITLLRADTVKLNYLSSRLILAANDEIAELENMGIEVPLGYMTKLSSSQFRAKSEHKFKNR